MFSGRNANSGNTGLDAEERYPLRKKLSHYYQAPFNKFLFTFLTFLGFLGLFSYYVLVDLRPFGASRGLTWIEILLHLWVISLLMEEIFQIIRTKNDGPLNMRRRQIRQHFGTLTRVWFWYEILEFVIGYFVLVRVWYRLKEWIADGWNKWDALMILTYYVTFILHYFLDVTSFGVVKIMYSFTVLLFYIRLLRFLMVVEYIGPKVIMIREMVIDILYFILMLVIFTAGFGIAYNALLSPTLLPSQTSNVTWRVAMDVFYRPYWQMYGELFLEDIERDATTSAMASSVCRGSPGFEMGDPHTWSSCYTGWMVPIFVGAYMLITNVLLLNLLIAMFSYSFEKIQGEARRLWRFHFFNLVYEYQQMTILPPPLSLLYYVIVTCLAIFYLVWYSCEKLFCTCIEKCRCCMRGRRRLKGRLANFMETPLQTVTMKWSQEAERQMLKKGNKSWSQECAAFQRQCSAKLRLDEIKEQRSTQLVRDYVSALETKLVNSTRDLKGRINLLQDRTDDAMSSIRSLQQQNTESQNTINRTARHIERLHNPLTKFIRCGQITEMDWIAPGELRCAGSGIFIGRDSLNAKQNFFEIEITEYSTQTDPEVGIGLVHEGYRAVWMPGWGVGSVAYHSDDGRVYNENGSSTLDKVEGAECRKGDIMGCRVIVSDKFDGRCDSIHHERIRVIFTKNGKQIYEDTFDYKGSGLLPAVGIHTEQTCVRLLNYDVTDTADSSVCSYEEARTVSVNTKIEKGHMMNMEMSQTSGPEYELTYSPEKNSGRPVGIFISKSTVTALQNYFELRIENHGMRRTIAIGLVNSAMHAGFQPGWDEGTVGYHADDGALFVEAGYPKKGTPKHPCVHRDVMGCGLAFNSDVKFTLSGTPCKNQNLQIYFTKNGKMVHKCWLYYRGGGLIPAVGMHSDSEKVTLRGYVKPPSSISNFFASKDIPAKQSKADGATSILPSIHSTTHETSAEVQLPTTPESSVIVMQAAEDQRKLFSMMSAMQLSVQRLMTDVADMRSDIQSMRKSQHKKFRTLESRMSFTAEDAALDTQ